VEDAKESRPEVVDTAVRVDQGWLRRQRDRHRVDGEVAASEIFGDRRRGDGGQRSGPLVGLGTGPGEVDVEAVDADRGGGEALVLDHLAAEDTAPRALELIAEWSLLELPGDAVGLAGQVRELAARPPWSGFADPTAAILAASGFGHAAAPVRRAAAELAGATPERPSQAVREVKGTSPVELLLARAIGAEWLDRYVEEWSKVSLEIDGADLLKNGVEEGPAVGRGLEAALSAKLDGEISGRDEELRIALAAARGEIPED